MRRCAVSIASSIAEGSLRGTDKDFLNFLVIANSSTAELETQFIITKNQNYISDESIFEKHETKIVKIRKMFFGFIAQVRNSN